MKARIVFLYYGDVTEGIFDSQVHYHLEMMVQLGLDCTLLVLFPVKALLKHLSPSVRKLRGVSRNGIRVIVLPALNPLRPQGNLLNLLYAYLFSLVIRWCHSIRTQIIIHCRGIFCACLAQRIKRFGGMFRCVFDMRAEEVSELSFRLEKKRIKPSSARRLVKATQKMQVDSLRGSDIWLMVSSALRNYVEQHLGLYNPHTFIIPSLARSDIFRYDPIRRKRMRRRLRLDGMLVLGYSGSVSAWQKVDVVMDILNLIRSQGREAMLLLLTRETEEARRLADEKACSAYTRIMSCEYRTLGDHIMCFDVGFLLRERLTLNQVASPTKFAEYILCGVPVLTTSGIGDLGDIVNTQRVGLCLHDLNNHEEIARALNCLLDMRFDREAISRFGQSMFAREAYLSLYQQLYSYGEKPRK